MKRQVLANGSSLHCLVRYRLYMIGIGLPVAVRDKTRRFRPQCCAGAVQNVPNQKNFLEAALLSDRTILSFTQCRW